MDALKQQLQREINTLETSLASVEADIESYETELKALRARRNTAREQKRRLETSLAGLEGRTRKRKSSPENAGPAEEVEIDLEDADPEAIAEIERRNASEQRARN